MCGILGGNNPEWDYKAGILSMKHRGPDGQRIIRFNTFVMAFARLSIIDFTVKYDAYIFIR
jgi:asparagine synthetase B (glutamine-hydrolysing)